MKFPLLVLVGLLPLSACVFVPDHRRDGPPPEHRDERDHGHDHDHDHDHDRCDHDHDEHC